MEGVLTTYVRVLRQAGAAVSTLEALDAARTAELIGYEDRALLKTALGAVLAKSVDEAALHDRLFELYFSAEAHAAPTPSDEDTGENTGENRGENPGESADADRGTVPSEGRQAAGEAGGPSAAEVVARLRSLADAPGAAAALSFARAADAAGVNAIRFASQKAYFTSRVLSELGAEALDGRILERLAARTDAGEAEAADLIALRERLRRRARREVDRAFETFGRSATEAFMNEVAVERAISTLSPGDLDRMRDVVARMAKRLAVRHARRLRRRQRGRLDVRRTLRAAAGQDGVPVSLYWRRTRRDRPKIVAICDVSGSVARYVRFLLFFLSTLHAEVADLEAFAFSSRLADVGPLLKDMPFDAAMEHIVRHIGSGSTDYGQALEDLMEVADALIDRRTTVLILGDGRTNDADPRLDLFAIIAERAKRVVWLSPEPPSSWGSGDSRLLDYQPFCSLVSHCATPADIERAIDEALLAYQ